jgi:hypothetical protein
LTALPRRGASAASNVQAQAIQFVLPQGFGHIHHGSNPPASGGVETSNLQVALGKPHAVGPG